MAPAEQLKLIRDFMLVLTPVITQETLRNSEQQSPLENAQMTLEFAIHLASKFATCHDTFCAQTPENAPKTDALKEELKAHAASQREAQGGAAEVY